MESDSGDLGIGGKSPDSQGEFSGKDLTKNSSQLIASEIKDGTCFSKSYVPSTKYSGDSPNDSTPSSNNSSKFNYREYMESRSKKMDQIMGKVRNEYVLKKYQGEKVDQEIIKALTPSFAAELKISKDDTSNDNKLLKRPSDSNEKLSEHSTKKRGGES